LLLGLRDSLSIDPADSFSVGLVDSFLPGLIHHVDFDDMASGFLQDAFYLIAVHGLSLRADFNWVRRGDSGLAGEGRRSRDFDASFV
jgi:hypothetical protein